MKSEKLKIKARYLIISFMIASIAITGCAKKQEPKPKEAKTEADAGGMPAKASDDVQHKIMSFNLEGLTDKGTKNWDVTGKSAESITETKVRLNDIVANAYGEEAQATITADKGIYDKTKNNVTLEDHVKATIVNTRNAASDLMDLSGDPSKDRPNPSGDNEKTEKTKTVITCDGEVVFDYENNQAFFNKNVKVKTEDGNIDADRITVYLDRSTRKITNIVAEGNVKITSGENVTYSEKATYIEADKKVMLTGRPRLVIYQEGGIEKGLIGGK